MIPMLKCEMSGCKTELEHLGLGIEPLHRVHMTRWTNIEHILSQRDLIHWGIATKQKCSDASKAIQIHVYKIGSDSTTRTELWQWRKQQLSVTDQICQTEQKRDVYLALQITVIRQDSPVSGSLTEIELACFICTTETHDDLILLRR